MNAAGYSGTPLARKLGIKAGMRLRLVHAPADYTGFFTDFPENVTIQDTGGVKADLVHAFFQCLEDLERELPVLREQIAPDGAIWVSWYKKAAKQDTDITEDEIRAIALANRLVDIKVCAVSTLWSGLKLVVPFAER